MEPVLSLMSGGFDSTVASYQMLQRGVLPHFVFFNLGGRAHELGVRQVAHYLWEKYAASHRLRFISVPFEGVVAEILQNVDNSQMRSEEHTSELQSRPHLVCRLLLEKKKDNGDV